MGIGILCSRRRSYIAIITYCLTYLSELQGLNSSPPPPLSSPGTLIGQMPIRIESSQSVLIR